MANFKHHSYFPKAKAIQQFRFPFVCFGCRKSFKFPASSEKRVCPQYRTPMEMLSRKFSAPKSKDVAQWQKVQFLVERGFRFNRAYRLGGESQVMRYPATLKEARIFVHTHTVQAARAQPPSNR